MTRTALQVAEEAAAQALAEAQRLRDRADEEARQEQARQDAEAARLLTAKAHVAAATMRHPYPATAWADFVAAVRAGTSPFHAWLDYRRTMLEHAAHHTLREGVIRMEHNARQQRLIDARNEFAQRLQTATYAQDKSVRTRLVQEANTAINAWLTEHGGTPRHPDTTTPPGWDDFGITGIDNAGALRDKFAGGGLDYEDAMRDLVKEEQDRVHAEVYTAAAADLDTLARAALDPEPDPDPEPEPDAEGQPQASASTKPFGNTKTTSERSNR